MIPALLLAMALLWLPLTGMASSVLGDAGNAPSPSDPEVSDSKPSGTTVPSKNQGSPPQKNGEPDSPIPVIKLKTAPFLEDNATNPALGDQNPAAFLRADKLSGQKDQFMDAQGHAELRRQGLVIEADHLHYDQPTDTVEATGNVRMIRNDTLLLESPHGFYQLGGQIGVMDSPHFSYRDPGTLLWTPPPASYVVPLPGTPIQRPPLWFIQGIGKEMDLTAGDKETLLNTTFSTCKASTPDWFIRTPKLDLDHTLQEGDAHDATLNFKGEPLLYSPDFTFPLDNQRRSGLLSPVIGSSSTTGQDIAVPYYLNLAPNIDDTVTPRFMSTRGLQLGNEVRYLDPSMSGILSAEYLPHDSQLGTDRWFTSWTHNQVLAPGLTFNANVQSASDPNYMNDLNTLIGPQGLVYLPRSLNLSYTGIQNWQFGVNSLNYQPLLGGVAQYRIDPQLSAHGFLNDWHGLNLDMSSQYTNFVSPGPNSLAGTAVANGITYNGNYQSIVSGSRLHVNPTVTIPWRNNEGFVTFKTGMDFTQYNLGQFNTSPQSVYNRTLPITSLDSGLYLDRNFNLGGKDYQQTLEPRLYYVYIPYRNQNNLPIFDTGLSDFNASTIFTENQFDGIDRINNANQLTAAVTSRLLNPATGGEMVRALLGERFYFTQNQVLLPGELPPVSSASDIIAAFTAAITERWNFDSYFNFGAQSHRTQQMATTIAYTPAAGKVFNLGYRIDTPLQGMPTTVINYLGQATTFIPGITGPIPINDLTSVKQWDISGQWPITSRLSFLGRLAYSTLDNQVLEALTGVEYNAGCWALRVISSRFPVSPIQTDTAFYVQLELGPLGLGPNPLDTLRYNIPGYTKTNEISPQ